MTASSQEVLLSLYFESAKPLFLFVLAITIDIFINFTGTYSNFKVLQSSKIALSFLPIPTANWSIIPEFTPINLFSATWHILTISTISTSSLNKSLSITAVKTSIEADEESPAPFGIFPKNSTSKPLSIL